MTLPVREHQQHVDLAILEAIEAEADDRRRDVAVLEHTVRELRDRIEELGARLDLLGALSDDLVELVAGNGGELPRSAPGAASDARPADRRRFPHVGS